MNGKHKTLVGGKEYLHANVDTKNYQKSSSIWSNCLAILFVNQGTNSVNINGKILAEGESWNVTMPDGYIDRTQYFAQFIDSEGTNNLVVDRILPEGQSLDPQRR